MMYNEDMIRTLILAEGHNLWIRNNMRLLSGKAISGSNIKGDVAFLVPYVGYFVERPIIGMPTKRPFCVVRVLSVCALSQCA